MIENYRYFNYILFSTSGRDQMIFTNYLKAYAKYLLLMGLIYLYFYYADLSKQQAEATVLAKTKMADLRNFQVLTTTPGYNAYSDIISGSSATIGSNATYTTTWTVTTNTSPAYKTINMIVSWLDRRGTTKNVNLTSIISQIDPETSGALIYG